MSNTEQNNSGRIPHFEKTIESEDKFVGRVIHVKLDKVELEDGSESMREIVAHPGGVAVAALTENNELLFVRQLSKQLTMI